MVRWIYIEMYALTMKVRIGGAKTPTPRLLSQRKCVVPVVVEDWVHI